MRSAFKKLTVNKHSVDLGLLFAVTLCAVISTLLIYSIVRSGISELEGVGPSYWKTQLISMGIGVLVAVMISFLRST